MVGSHFIGSKSLDNYYLEIENFEIQIDVYDKKLVDHLVNWFDKNQHIKEWQLGCFDNPHALNEGVCYVSWIDENGHLQMEGFEYREEY